MILLYPEKNSSGKKYYFSIPFSNVIENKYRYRRVFNWNSCGEKYRFSAICGYNKYPFNTFMA